MKIGKINIGKRQSTASGLIAKGVTVSLAVLFLLGIFSDAGRASNVESNNLGIIDMSTEESIGNNPDLRMIQSIVEMETSDNNRAVNIDSNVQGSIDESHPPMVSFSSPNPSPLDVTISFTGTVERWDDKEGYITTNALDIAIEESGGGIVATGQVTTWGYYSLSFTGTLPFTSRIVISARIQGIVKVTDYYGL